MEVAHRAHDHGDDLATLDGGMRGERAGSGIQGDAGLSADCDVIVGVEAARAALVNVVERADCVFGNRNFPG